MIKLKQKIFQKNIIPIGETLLVPQMTSSVDLGFTIFASSVFQNRDDLQPWGICTPTTVRYWHSAPQGNPFFIEIRTPLNKKVTKVKGITGNQWHPTSFKVLGSNDNTNFTEIFDTGSNLGIGSNVPFDFTFSNNIEYSTYRVQFFTPNTYVTMSRLHLYY